MKDKIDIRGMMPEELAELMLKNDEKKFRGLQVFSWIQKKNAQDLKEIKNIGIRTRKILKQNIRLSPLKIVQSLISEDGTRKYLWELADEERIETVYMHHEGERTKTRNTLCLSTQVGCPMKCSFCATGQMSYSRNLSAGEIVSQVIDVTRHMQAEIPDFKVQNLVYMGMGEPLLNLANVIKSIRILNSPEGQQISQRRITVSTCGLVPKIKELMSEDLDIVLAVSLHAPNNEIRERLMPINKEYPLQKLIPVCREYANKTGRRITFEYVMIKGINDAPEHAEQLAELLVNINANVNIIPINEHSNSIYKRSPKERIKAFVDVLTKKSVQSVIREEKGSDIAAACGQLAGEER